MPTAKKPCLSCGACCSAYRVSFYWRETTLDTPEGVPVELTEELTPFRRCMRGTNQPEPRCVALAGEAGTAVFCSIHPRRPAPCRDFAASYEDGPPHDRCDQVRARFGMAPLTPADWHDTPDSPAPENPGTGPAVAA